MAHGPSRSAACGIFPDQGSNPCPLHWQADSQSLRHQGSPCQSALKKAAEYTVIDAEKFLHLKAVWGTVSTLKSLVPGIFRRCSFCLERNKALPSLTPQDLPSGLRGDLYAPPVSQLLPPELLDVIVEVLKACFPLSQLS